jgi:5-methylcytosine-specific restriction protein A
VAVDKTQLFAACDLHPNRESNALLTRVARFAFAASRNRFACGTGYGVLLMGKLTHVKLRTQADRVPVVDTRRVKPPAKKADPFYLSREWRQLMASIIAERGRVCEDPDCNGRTHSADMRVFGDHVVELRDGGASLDRRNIMLRCGASHTRKTMQERARRLAASPEGMGV